jgi:hypothetical protein
MFEAGAYFLIEPLRLSNARPSIAQLQRAQADGVVKTFQKQAHEVAELGLYHRFIAGGWTLRLSRDVRVKLAPRMARMITLAWYCALQDAQKQVKS